MRLVCTFCDRFSMRKKIRSLHYFFGKKYKDPISRHIFHLFKSLKTVHRSFHFVDFSSLLASPISLFYYTTKVFWNIYYQRNESSRLYLIIRFRKIAYTSVLSFWHPLFIVGKHCQNIDRFFPLINIYK